MSNLGGRIARLTARADRRRARTAAHRDRNPVAELSAKLEAGRQRMIESGTLPDPADIPPADEVFARLRALLDGGDRGDR